MNNNAIHQSLVEIEANLKNLESARRQVVTVSSNSEKLVSVITKLLAELERLKGHYQEERQQVVKGIESNIQVLQNTLDKGADDFHAESDKALKKYTAITKKLLTELGTISQQTQDALRTSVETFDNRLEAGAKEVFTKTRFIIDAHEKQVDSLLERMAQLRLAMATLTSKIQTTDFKEEFTVLQEKLSKVKNNIETTAADNASLNREILQSIQSKNREVLQSVQTSVDMIQQQNKQQRNLLVVLGLMMFIILVAFVWKLL